jgi:hypothetical protein
LRERLRIPVEEAAALERRLLAQMSSGDATAQELRVS